MNIPYSLVTAGMRKSLLLWGAVAVFAIVIALVAGLFFARQITSSLSVAATATGPVFGAKPPLVVWDDLLRRPYAP